MAGTSSSNRLTRGNELPLSNSSRGTNNSQERIVISIFARTKSRDFFLSFFVSLPRATKIVPKPFRVESFSVTGESLDMMLSGPPGAVLAHLTGISPTAPLALRHSCRHYGRHDCRLTTPDSGLVLEQQYKMTN